jgi:hypothetical protein
LAVSLKELTLRHLATIYLKSKIWRKTSKAGYGIGTARTQYTMKKNLIKIFIKIMWNYGECRLK